MGDMITLLLVAAVVVHLVWFVFFYKPQGSSNRGGHGEPSGYRYDDDGDGDGE